MELARRLSPDVAILDVKMPGRLDGIEAAQRILSDRSLPILLLTAYSDAPMVRRAANAGVFGYLAKPFRPSEIRDRVRSASAMQGRGNGDMRHMDATEDAAA